MMNTQTIDKMSQMRLSGMKDAYETILQTHQDLTFEEVVTMVVDAEWEWRHNRKMNRYIKQAGFRYQASIEEIDFQASRNLNKNILIRLADCSYIERAENILITGSTGVGKSFIASALGHQACQKGYKVAYFNLQKLFSLLRMSKADQSYHKIIKRLEGTDLLILDDFGLQPFDHENRLALLEIIDDRASRKSTIISAQLPVKSWYDVINDKTIADAMLDRIVHQAFRIELNGESMRKLKKTKQPN
jgi:DNA replication protein DnaC